MKRGMISLTPQNAAILEKNIAVNPLLTEKLHSIQQANTSQTHIELSEEELEYLLDAVPMDNTELRKQLSAFLQQLRS